MRLDKVNEAHAKGTQVVTAKELAEMLEIGAQQLARRRCKQTGPRFIKQGRHIFYRLEDVMEWLAGGQTFASTTEVSAFKAGLLSTKRSKPSRRLAA
jgi:hypothetical protein